MQQLSFASVGFERFGKTTRRAAFLSEMDAVVPWRRLYDLIAPFYPKPGKGRRPVGLDRMLRIYFLQHWFGLSDPAAEEALYDSEVMRRLVGIDLGREPVPDETTILNFRHLLERHELCGEITTRTERVSGHARLTDFHRHNRRRDHHACAVLDEERGEGARSRDAPDTQRQPMVFWH